MSGTIFSLAPAVNDISVGLLNGLLGQGWESLATGGSPAGTGVLIAQLLAVLNVSLLGFISALLLWQTTIGAMATAHEGTPLGKRYHSIWAPVRAPLSFLMVTPLPMAKGLSLLQVTLLFCVHMSIGVADSVWTTFVQFIPTQTYSATSETNKDNDATIVKNMIYNAVAREYMSQNGSTTFYPSSAQWAWKADSFVGADSGVFTLRDYAVGNAGEDFGSVSIHCSGQIAVVPDKTASVWSTLWGWGSSALNTVNQAAANAAGYGPQTNPACQSEVKSINDVYTGAWVIADQIVTQNAHSGAPPPATPISDQIGDLINKFQTAQIANSALVSKVAGAALQKQQADFANTASDLGWASSTFFYWKMANISQQVSVQMKTLYPEVSSADMTSITDSTGHSVEQYMQTTRDLIGYADQKALEKANKNYGIDSDSWGFSAMAAWCIRSFTTGDPILSIASWGNGAMDAGETVMAATAAVDILSQAGGKAASIAGPVGKAVGGVISGAAKKIGAGFYMLSAFLIIEGVIGAYVIPSMPSLIMISAVTGWVILVLEMLVAAALWAAAHAYAEGEGLASPEAKQGYAIAIGIIFRPVLITFGFIFAYILITTMGHFTGMTLSMFFGSLLAGKVVGPVAAVSIILIALSTVMMVLKQVLNLTTHLADHVPRWMGGQGASLGETNTAQSAIHAAEGFAKGSGKAGVAYVAGKGMGGNTRTESTVTKNPTTVEDPAANRGATEAQPENPSPSPHHAGDDFTKGK